MYRPLTLIVLLAMLVSCTNLNMADKDEKALENLHKSGSDLSQVHPFDFYLYHQHEPGAKDLCSHLEAEGFLVNVREGAIKGEWLCLASVRFVPSVNKLQEYQALFDTLIDEYGGEYDGWETIVISR